MPNNKSAEKRVRQGAKRRSLNNWRKKRVRAQIKSFLSAVSAHDVDTAEAEFRRTVAVLDKISSTSAMHKNTAARRKSRLAKRLNALKSSD